MKKKSRHFIYLFVLMGVFLILTNSCKKDENNNSNQISKPGPNVTDIDGNVYHSVIIGTQTWMVENLKVTKYRDGTSIPNVKDNTTWDNLTTGAYCNYNNTDSNSKTYGRLYNWYAVNDSRNVAPAGWHVPTDAEWSTLENYVAANSGTSGSVAKALAATINWCPSTNTGAIGNDQSKNNSSGFTALPSGCRYYPSTFTFFGSNGYWWSSTEYSTYLAWYRNMDFDYSYVTRSHLYSKDFGFSVRCLRD